MLERLALHIHYGAETEELERLMAAIGWQPGSKYQPSDAGSLFLSGAGLNRAIDSAGFLRSLIEIEEVEREARDRWRAGVLRQKRAIVDSDETLSAALEVAFDAWEQPEGLSEEEFYRARMDWGTEYVMTNYRVSKEIQDLLALLGIMRELEAGLDRPSSG